MSHANASLTPTGRLRLARCIVDDGWPLRRAADRFDVSVTTATRWAGRYRLQRQGRHARPLEPAEGLSAAAGPAHRAENHGVASLPTVGTGADRVPATAEPGHCPQGLDPVRRPHRCLGPTPLPAPRCGPSPRRDGTSTRRRATLSTSTSRSWAGSRTAVGTVCTAARRTTGSRRPPSRAPRSSTTRSTTTPGWRTARSWPTSVRRPRQRSGPGRTRTSPPAGSRSSGS